MSERTEEAGLLGKLEGYGRSDAYPFHMPGHKRQIRLGITSFPNPFSVDITEIEGFDNLHRPGGILREAMERAAGIYGSEKTYFMVNGSTGGILSAVCGLTRPGDAILMARNCHKAAYHGVMLNQLRPVYVYPRQIQGWGIQGGVSAAEVEMLLRVDQKERGKAAEHKEQGGAIKAVFITSPTYDGIVSDIRGIAEAAHRYRIPLIVDEAHGAHFPFGESFPESALECGADVVIQSLHKTLPSLTQTAVLHVKGELADAEEIERYLSVFQTSSPSYVFLASMQNCVEFMDGKGREEMRCFAARLGRWMEKAGSLQSLRVLTDEECGLAKGEARDPSKILVSPAGSGLTGTELSGILRDRFHLEAEMACKGYALFMTSFMDSEEGLKRLWEALCAIDEMNIGKMKTEDSKSITERLGAGCGSTGRIRPSDAWRAGKERIFYKDACGRISGGFITVYPPGIPMAVPGERITENITEWICESRGMGLTVEGVSEDGKVEVCSSSGCLNGY